MSALITKDGHPSHNLQIGDCVTVTWQTGYAKPIKAKVIYRTDRMVVVLHSDYGDDRVHQFWVAANGTCWIQEYGEVNHPTIERADIEEHAGV